MALDCCIDGNRHASAICDALSRAEAGRNLEVISLLGGVVPDFRWIKLADERIEEWLDLADLIDAQGRCLSIPELGEHQFDVCTQTDGTIVAIDCPIIARIARLAGAPMHKVGQQVRAGEVLYRIHAHSETGLQFARELAEANPGYSVG